MMNKAISLIKSPKFNLKTELLAGLTVAMTMIPESLSFAILAGLAPLIGLYAAFLMGFITAIFGGRPGMVSGGAGSTIVVLIALVSTHGPEYLFAAVALGGIFQALVGVFKLGKFVRLIPQPVMYGFLNGLAIIIFMAQVEQFKVAGHSASTWLKGAPLLIMLALTLATILIVLVFPKLTKAVPASLVAIIVISILVYCLEIHTKKVVDIAQVSGRFPAFHLPDVPYNWQTLQIVLPYSLLMAGVGLIETLLTLNMVDELTQTKGRANQEAVAQGAANIVNGLFGGMGGCAMVAQTLVNIEAGAKTKLAGVIGAVTILLIILVGGTVIEQIPMAALVGVMMMVAINTFKWGSLRIIRKMPKSDVFVGILVTAITVILQNLALAVLIGVVISALVFAWDNAKRIRARKSIDSAGHKVYEIYGPLFFGSTTAFIEKFDVDQDPQNIVIDFKESRVADMSAIDALKNITQKYQTAGKQVVLRHLSQDCRKILKDAAGFIEVNIQEDPTYPVMPK